VFFGQLGYYLQTYKILTTHETKGVSLLGLCVGPLAAISWFLYAIMIEDSTMFLANIVGMIGAIGTIVEVLLYQS